MPEFETVSDQVDLLRRWAEVLPRQLTDASDAAEATAKLGERHGSWVLSIDWESDGLFKSAEIALTNPDPTPDDVATSVVVSVRASASTVDRYVSESIYERRRGARRLASEQLLDWLSTAVRRANQYRAASLTNSYLTGLEHPE